MLQKKKSIKFGDKVQINSGFYGGEIAILTYLCPESGCYCGYINGDGTEQLHYFYEDQIDVIDGGFYFPYEDAQAVAEDDNNCQSTTVLRLTKKPR